MISFDASTPRVIWDSIKTEARQRGWWLFFFTWLANFYLFSFGLDGVLSTLDDLRRLVSGGDIASLRESVSVFVFFFSVLMVFVLMIVHQLPKRVLLAPILFSIWVALGAIPIWMTPDHIKTSLVFSLIQIGIFAVAINVAHARSGKWRLTPASLPRKRHVALRVITGFVVSALVLPMILTALLFVGFAQVIERQTDGYLHFTSESVESRETVFVKGNKTIYLIGMIHIAEPQFYRTVFTGFPPDALVLAEGVTDRKGLMAEKLSYRNAASVLGLEQQPDIRAALGEKPSQPANGGATSKDTAGERVLRADIDLSDFAPGTINFLKEVGRIYASSSLKELLDRIAAIDDAMKPEDLKQVTADILDKRNDKIISVFKEQLAHRNTLAIAWGAIHMPAIEKAVRAEGFTLSSQRNIPAIRYNSLWESFKRGLSTLL